MIIKRTAALILAALLVLGTAACGTTSDQRSDGDSAEPGNIENVPDVLGPIFGTETQEKDAYANQKLTDKGIFVDQPYATRTYIRELNWVVFNGSDITNYHSAIYDLTTGERVEAEYERVYPFSEGLARVEKVFVEYKSTTSTDYQIFYKKVGFIDESGAVVVPMEYSEAGDFSDGLACVVKSDHDGDNAKYGYIDKTGKEVVPLEYDYAGTFSDGCAVVGLIQGNGSSLEYGYIDTSGALIAPIEYGPVRESFSEGLALVEKMVNGDLAYGFIDTSGEIVIPLEYRYGSKSFSEGLAAVSNSNINSKYGFIDKSGRIVIPFEYDDAEPFSDGLAVVGIGDWSGKKYGYVDQSGAVVIPIEYDSAEPFSDGMAIVGKKSSDGFERKYGFIDTTGTVVVPLEYTREDLKNFNHGIGAIYTYPKTVIDKNGEQVAEYIDSDLVGPDNEIYSVYFIMEGYKFFRNPHYND